MDTRGHEATLGETGLRTRWYTFSGGGSASGGEAPVFLGLHMLGLDGSSFAGLARHLPGNSVLYSFDQRGHGAAAGQPPARFGDFVEDARAALERIGRKRVHLVGCSMGGSVAAELAAQEATERLASLSLVATPSHGHAVFSERASACRTWSLEPAIRATIERWFGSKPVRAAVATAEKGLRAMTPEGHDACWRAFAAFAGYERIASSLPRTLCVSFSEDRSTPSRELARIAACIRDSGVSCRHAVLPGAGHAGMLVRPGALARVLMDFCEAT